MVYGYGNGPLALSGWQSRTAAQQSDEVGHRIALLQVELYRLASTFVGFAESVALFGAAYRRTVGRRGDTCLPESEIHHRDTPPDVWSSVLREDNAR